jgi:hypothetical protein
MWQLVRTTQRLRGIVVSRHIREPGTRCDQIPASRFSVKRVLVRHLTKNPFFQDSSDKLGLDKRAAHFITQKRHFGADHSVLNDTKRQDAKRANADPEEPW